MRPYILSHVIPMFFTSALLKIKSNFKHIIVMCLQHHNHE